MMSLASLFDDFPLIAYDNGYPRRRRFASRPLVCSILNSLEDQMDQKVGHVFRRLPAIMSDLENEFENKGQNTRKRKLRSGTVSDYEPKSKVVVSNKDNKFQVSMDTSNYQPEEITVKVVNDKLAISAKHEAKGNDVYEYSEMYRSFELPENVDPNSVTSHLNANGELIVEAPLKALPEVQSRNIPVSIEGKQKQAVESSKTPTKEKSSS